MSVKRNLYFLALFAIVCSVHAASTDNLPPPVTLSAAADHRRLMDLLHIATIPSHPDNYDEAIANPYPNLPDPLVMNDGTKVTSADMWWNQRRPEILEYFEREIYGRTPKETPTVKWEVVSNVNDGKTITKQLVGHVDNSSYPLVSVNIAVTLVTPTDAKGPVPVIMQLWAPFVPRRSAASIPARPPPTTATTGPSGPTWQQQLLTLGWGYAMINTSTIQADNGAGLTSGIIGLVNKGQPRAVDDWGALAAWGWGCSRALDYFQTDPAVNAKEVGLEGHSRWGKGAIVAMALDPRFAIVYCSSSGEGGAKIHRHNYGESLEAVAGVSEYHWMAGNFLKYAGHWDQLPVDSHELIALCAPRPVFITGGTWADRHADAEGEFQAVVGAGPVYKLLGKQDAGTTEMPKPNVALIDGDVAFRQHEGGHTDALDWPTFLIFAQKYFGPGK